MEGLSVPCLNFQKCNKQSLFNVSRMCIVEGSRFTYATTSGKSAFPRAKKGPFLEWTDSATVTRQFPWLVCTFRKTHFLNRAVMFIAKVLRRSWNFSHPPCFRSCPVSPITSIPALEGTVVTIASNNVTSSSSGWEQSSILQVCGTPKLNLGEL